MTEIDFTGFLLAHKCMRREYGRLAETARHSRDVGHQALIAEHIEVTLSVLHHHHAEEDNWLWPTLRERAPAASSALERLEAQHAQIDPLIAAAADTSRLLPERAPVLAELHEAINTHLDEEEQLILPLAAAHLSTKEWDAFGQRALASIPRRYLPIVLGWVSSEATPQEWAPVQQMLPRLVRLLAQTFWVPAYAKRRRHLYPQPVKTAGAVGVWAASDAALADLAADIEGDVARCAACPSLVSDAPSHGSNGCVKPDPNAQPSPSRLW